MSSKPPTDFLIYCWPILLFILGNSDIDTGKVLATMPSLNTKLLLCNVLYLYLKLNPKSTRYYLSPLTPAWCLAACKYRWKRSWRGAGEILYLSENFVTNSKIRQFCRYCCLFWNTVWRSFCQAASWHFLPTVCSVSDAAFVDRSCDWSSAKHWAQWWARAITWRCSQNHFL